MVLTGWHYAVALTQQTVDGPLVGTQRCQAVTAYRVFPQPLGANVAQAVLSGMTWTGRVTAADDYLCATYRSLQRSVCFCTTDCHSHRRSLKLQHHEYRWEEANASTLPTAIDAWKKLSSVTTTHIKSLFKTSPKRKKLHRVNIQNHFCSDLLHSAAFSCSGRVLPLVHSNDTYTCSPQQHYVHTSDPFIWFINCPMYKEMTASTHATSV